MAFKARGGAGFLLISTFSWLNSDEILWKCVYKGWWGGGGVHASMAALKLIHSQHYALDLPWIAILLWVILKMIDGWYGYMYIQDWPWIESNLRLTLNFDSVHAYRGAILSSGWVGRPKVEAVLSKGVQCSWKHQLWMPTSGFHVALVTAMQLRCSGDNELFVFSVSFSLCVNSLSFE